jgi:ACT domain-containing protein
VIPVRGCGVGVVGSCRTGLTAGRLSQKLAEQKINILDVSQTIMGDFFTMMMLVDLTNAEKDFEGAREQLHELGTTLGVKISIQNQEIFDTMHKL